MLLIDKLIQIPIVSPLKSLKPILKHIKTIISARFATCPSCADPSSYCQNCPRRRDWLGCPTGASRRLFCWRLNILLAGLDCVIPPLRLASMEKKENGNAFVV